MNKNINNDIFDAYLEKLIPDVKSRDLLKTIFKNQQKATEVKATDTFRHRDISVDKAINDVKKLLVFNKAMKSSLTDLKNENVKLIERYRKLIGALGACECLGENPICPMCEGKGIPGNKPIDETSFFRYVYPLIQRITTSTTAENAVKNESTDIRKN